MTKTNITSVGNKTQSLRTVIPLWIVKVLKLSKGDKIEWDVDVHNSTIEIKKVKELVYFLTETQVCNV